MERDIGDNPAAADEMIGVDRDGYLVRLQTAGDLLRAFKTIWRATEP